jgi:hypothetical protein
MLPIEWRIRRVQVLQQQPLQHAQAEYKPEHRLSQLMDHLFAQFRVLTPLCNEALCLLSGLDNLKDWERSEKLAHIETRLQEFDRRLQELMVSPLCREIGQLTPHLVAKEGHLTCPPSPFPVIQFKFPEAGFLLIQRCSYRCVISFYSALHDGENPTLRRHQNYKAASYFAWLVCTTFSSLDDCLGGNPDTMLPFGPALCMAASFGPNNESLQRWMMHKLTRLENAGFHLKRKCKEALAKWNTPVINPKRGTSN